MVRKEAIVDSIEIEVQKFAEALLKALRQGRGIDATAAAGLKQALGKAASTWESSETISKSAANLFVDLASGIGALRYSYPGEEGEKIEALGDEIGDLVRQCVGSRK
jgi:hypothetical protein